MDYQSQPQQADLLDEPLSDAEVRTLLERLGSAEFGGLETATLGAIVEATGSDLTTVGRLLAGIRKGEFEERFGLQLQDHGQRIETLEERAAYTTPTLDIADPRIRDAVAKSYAEQVEEERKASAELQRKALRSAGYVFLVMIVIITILAMIAAGSSR